MSKKQCKDTDRRLTPKWLLDRLSVIPFGLDPCDDWNGSHSRAETTFTKNGLGEDWSKYGPIWMNPPRSTIKQWVEKAFRECSNGVLLLPAATDTKWFALVWEGAHRIGFFSKRLRFEIPRDLDVPSGFDSAKEAYCLALLGPDYERHFRTAMEPYTRILRP